MVDAQRDRNKMASRDLPAPPRGREQPADNQRDQTTPAEDDHFDERHFRPELKRTSSGIVSDVTPDSLEYSSANVDDNSYRKGSDDSGTSSPFVHGKPSFFEKGLSYPTVASSAGKDVQDVHKEVANELNERFKRIARSNSQGEIQVKKSLDKNEREKKTKQPGQTFTNKTGDPRQVLPLLTRAKTLPHGRTSPPKGKSTGRSIKTRFNNLTKSFRRSPKENPATKENNSDSESYGRSKIQPSPLLKRRSRSVENLLDLNDGYDQVRFAGPELPHGEPPKSAGLIIEGGDEYESFNYDIPQEVLPAGKDVHLSAKNKRWSQEDEAYESVEHVDGLPIASEDERRYSRFEPGSIQVDGSDGGRFPSATLSTKPPLTDRSTVDGKPIPSPRQSVRQKQLPPPKPPPAKEPILPAPSAEENCKMAHQAIRNVMNENPEARKTEIVIQTLNFVAKFCDAHGGYLEVGSKKATLFIPPFALDCDTLIYVQIEESYCLFGDQGHQIAPVVHCGEPGTQFSTAVILTFYTSIQDTRYFDVTGLRKQPPKAEPNDNEGKVATKGVRKETVQSANEDPGDWHETTEKEGKVMSVENGKCTVMLHHFTNDSLLATPKETERHFGKIGVIAFTSPVMKNGNIFDIRVWMSSNQEVLKEDERREMKDNQAKPLYHFCPTLCLFEDGGEVTVEITNLERRWSIYPNSSPQQQSVKLPKLRYMHDHDDQGIRESLVFRIHPTEQFVPREMVSFDIELYQPKRKDFGIRIPVCVEPELEQIPDVGTTNTDGQNLQFRVIRQSTPWKPPKESLERLDQSLSRNDNWKPLAAWLHLNVCDLEGFPNPATMMLSMVYQKHAVNRGEHIRKALEELDNALSTGKLGAGLREAGDIVREILGIGPAAQPTGSVAIRQPTEEVWPVSMSPIEVNEYRFNYHTLQSDPYASANVLGAIQPVQVDFNSNTDLHGATGGPPRTLVSNPHSPRLVRSVPTQEEWPPENNNTAQRAGGHSIQDNPTELVPKGPNEELRRKSSGYCTIPVINPNRPPLKTPDTSELHYDQPYIRQTGLAQANALANHLDDSSYDKVGAFALVPSVTSSTSDDLLNVDMSEVRRLSDVIREEHQDPPYQNLVTGTKPKEKGYLKSVPNSKVYHK